MSQCFVLVLVSLGAESFRRRMSLACFPLLGPMLWVKLAELSLGGLITQAAFKLLCRPDAQYIYLAPPAKYVSQTVLDMSFSATLVWCVEDLVSCEAQDGGR